MSDNWIKLSLDSTYFISGERVSGEVNCVASQNSKIILKSSGEEKLQINYLDGQQKKHYLKIYQVDQELGDAQGLCQLVFPFTFKIPQYLPATFNYKDKGDDGTEYDIDISYSLEVLIEHDSKILARDSAIFTMLNKLSWLILPSVCEFTQVLDSCCWVPGKICKISIESVDTQKLNCTDTVKFKVGLLSDWNSQLSSLVIQVVFEIIFLLPNQDSAFLKKVVCRSVQDTEDLKKNCESLNFLQVPFEVNIGKELGNNPCSNEAGSFRSEYKLQVMANYDIGVRGKLAECFLLLQVNPKPMDDIFISFPPNWNPRENHVRSLLATEDID